VRHNGSGRRFELEVEGQFAFLDYRMEDGKMVITHAFVPPELRGRKLAEQLVRAALKHARECSFRVVPQCGYVDALLRRHPEFDDLRAV
jgi:predicted GNAT family acetyltransferase